jgi:hypothetical protein
MLDWCAIPGCKSWAWIGWVKCFAAMAGLDGWEVGIDVLGGRVDLTFGRL